MYSQWTYKYKTQRQNTEREGEGEGEGEHERESLSNCQPKTMQQLREVGGRNQ